MSSILRRLKMNLKVWLHTLLEPAQDPRKIFAYAYQRHQELLDKVHHARLNISSARDQLETMSVDARNRLGELQDQARQALLAGREEKARLAIQVHQATELRLRALEEELGRLDSEDKSLSIVGHRLETQIDAFFTRQEVLKARYDAAEAQVRIQEAMGGISEELPNLGAALEQAEQQTEYMQSRVVAINELIELGVLSTDDVSGAGRTVSQFADLPDAEITEKQLVGLKRELGLG